MAIYWAFRLDAVAHSNLYLDEIRETTGYHDLSLAIEMFRNRLPAERPWVDLPM
ncbi:MAG: hypothetical protein JWQ02_3513 [Capsulimonas sp.]|nr:hypothetical protein [Capsulimonas sp.]